MGSRLPRIFAKVIDAEVKAWVMQMAWMVAFVSFDR